MARVRRYMNLINSWEQVVAAAEGLTHLGESRVKLQNLIQEARNLSIQQTSATATKQQFTKDLKEALRNGQLVADLLRSGAREHYGTESERLVEFGLQPFRGKTRSFPPPPPEGPEDEKPATAAPPTSTPAPDAVK